MAQRPFHNKTDTYIDTYIDNDNNKRFNKKAPTFRMGLKQKYQGTGAERYCRLILTSLGKLNVRIALHRQIKVNHSRGDISQVIATIQG